MGGCLRRPKRDDDDDEVLPQEIPELLNGDNKKLSEIYAKIPTAEATSAAEALTKYFLYYNQGFRLLDFVVTNEAKAAKTDGHLFLRTPTVGTRILQQLFSHCGGEKFVAALLAPKLSKVIQENIDFEFNPDTLSKRGILADQIENVQKNNLKQLETLVADILESLVQKAEAQLKVEETNLEDPNVLPEILFRICKCIKRRVSEEIPNYDPVYAASAFVFLRTICPAVISPVSNDHNYVLPETGSISQEARRSLVITAKVIQNVSTGSKREKEKWMTLSYDIVEKYHSKVADFISVLSSKEFSSEQFPSPKVQNAGVAYLQITRYLKMVDESKN